MFGLHSACLPKIRAIATGGALIVAIVAVGPTVATYADASHPTPSVDAVHTQRPISDDFLIDQNLVAALPTGDTDQRTAAIGPAMRPLVPQFNAIWPTRGLITTYYGEVDRLSPRGHSGLDIAAPEGTPVLAADDGEVLKAYWNHDGYGGLVIIGHPSGYETWYGHLDEFDVEVGQQVKRGEEIARMGSTGFSTGPHLHFEVRQDGQVVDPLGFLQEANLKDADW
jgi:murein DD-endopeptidase MepM/ murein hydrolase activator NlpD